MQASVKWILRKRSLGYRRVCPDASFSTGGVILAQLFLTKEGKDK